MVSILSSIAGRRAPVVPHIDFQAKTNTAMGIREVLSKSFGDTRLRDEDVVQDFLQRVGLPSG